MSRGGSRGHGLRPRIAARISISSSLLQRYDDLKILHFRFASRCLKDADGEHAKFKLTPLDGKVVNAPLIGECLANIECKVVDIVLKHNIVIMEAVAAHIDASRQEKRTLHAVGDGTFIFDGRRLDRRKMMASKLPAGI